MPRITTIFNKILDVPYYAQTMPSTCGPACLMMVDLVENLVRAEALKAGVKISMVRQILILSDQLYRRRFLQLYS